MDSIAWQTYDAFSGSSLNGALWTVDHMDGTLTTGNAGLTLSPTPLSSGTSKNKLAISATLAIAQGAFFAVQVPFSATSMGTPASGGAESFQIELDDTSGNNYSNMLWGIAHNFSSDGVVYNGTLFNASSSANQAGTAQYTSATAGRLGLIYSGNTVTTYYYTSGTGWQQLGAATSTTGWAFPLNITLQAKVNSSGSLTVVVPDVQYNESVTVPVQLSSGWNLISLPSQPTNTAIATVLSGLGSACEVVWAYPNQAWQVYDPNDTTGSTLTTMQAGMGYWIKMTSAKTLSVQGSAPSPSLPLLSGWNLVGYNGTSCVTLATAPSSIPANLQVSWGYPLQAWQFYDPANSGTSTLLQFCPGAGYWMNVNQAETWTIPSN
jgi:hypothetical protein